MIEQTDVFISHVPPDQETAEMLFVFLRGEGLFCTMSECGASAVAGTARLLVLVFSNHANASASVQEDVALAVKSGLPIIVFRTEDGQPTGRLKELLHDARWIEAKWPLITYVPDLVLRVAEDLDRDLPGKKAMFNRCRGEDQGIYTYTKITVDPPGTHIQVKYCDKIAEGLSPLYLTVTQRWLDIVAQKEGYEPDEFHLDDFEGTSCCDFCAGLSSWAMGPRPGKRRTFAGMAMAWCPAGEYMMGSPQDERERNDDEGPQHRVTFGTGFWLGKYPVTRQQWREVMGANAREILGVCIPFLLADEDQLPVNGVSWNDCQEFIRRLNSRGEGMFRLPSEAEWEYACRAGTTTPFYCGNTLSPDDANVLGQRTCSHKWVGLFHRGIPPKGKCRCHTWNVYDMHGTLWEWCQDTYHDSYDGAPEDGAAWESPGSTCRLLRGGSWSEPPGNCRAAVRNFKPSDVRSDMIGFRVLRVREDCSA